VVDRERQECEGAQEKFQMRAGWRAVFAKMSRCRDMG
jgi:hypothetical protein